VHNDTLCIALSGNPFAALATFELLVRPVLAKISRNSNMQYKRQKAVLQDDFIKESQERRFIRAHYKDGEVRLPAKNHFRVLVFSSGV
jgi:molybdopterin molybdotransferase